MILSPSALSFSFLPLISVLNWVRIARRHSHGLTIRSTHDHAPRVLYHSPIAHQKVILRIMYDI